MRRISALFGQVKAEPAQAAVVAAAAAAPPGAPSQQAVPPPPPPPSSDDDRVSVKERIAMLQKLKQAASKDSGPRPERTVESDFDAVFGSFYPVAAVAH